MAALGPDFPKCPVCGKPMESIALSEVPQRTRQEMVRYNRYQPLNQNFWCGCKDDGIQLHKLAVAAK